MVKGDHETWNKDHFGILTDIIHLDFFGENKVFLFKCDWWDVDHEGRGFQIDKYNYTSINVTEKWNTNEPFVLASQIEQIFYVNDTKLGSNWKVMVKTQSRELYDVSKHEDEVLSIDNEPYQQNESLNVSNTMNIGGDDIFSWHRDDIPPISIDTSHLIHDEKVNDDLDTFSND